MTDMGGGLMTIIVTAIVITVQAMSFLTGWRFRLFSWSNGFS